MIGRNLTFRAKLIFYSLSMGTLPLVLIAVVSSWVGTRQIQTVTDKMLQVVANEKKSAVETYFHLIRDQIISTAKLKETSEAALAFTEGYKSLAAKIAAEKPFEDARRELRSYYTQQFAAEYRKQNDGADVDVDSLLAGLEPEAVYMQWAYIFGNPHPLGSKHELMGRGDGSRYDVAHQKYHPDFKQFVDVFGYYDFFLADVDTGRLVYTVFKELDYATSLRTGPYKDTNFGEAFRIAADRLSEGDYAFVDFKQYTPSYDAPASFIATPLYHDGRKIAILLFQMPIERINKMMALSGIGESEESYLVGSDGLVRSDAQGSPEVHGVVSSFRHPAKARLSDMAVFAEVMAGRSGLMWTLNYAGTPSVMHYAPASILGQTWGVITSVAAHEVTAPMRKLYMLIAIVIVVVMLALLGFGYSFASGMAAPIIRITESLRDNSRHTISSSDRVQASSERMAALATDQSSAVEETAASTEEISSMVNNNVEQAQASAQLSTSVSDKAGIGNKAMAGLVASMAEIQESNKKIQELVKVIRGIGEKTAIIDEIVFQTKLLSFNASVEAERAGEHGRGFAVVAQEVGNLAQISGKAALEIASLVKTSVAEAEVIVSESREKVERGSEQVQQTASILADIEKSSRSLNDSAKQIVVASKEQADGISQVNTAMNQIDKTTQQSAEQAEEMSSLSLELRTNASQLVSLIGEFHEMIYRRGDQARAHSPDGGSASPGVSTAVEHGAKGPRGEIATHPKSGSRGGNGGWENL